MLDQCQSSEEVKAVLSGKPKKEEFYSNGGGPKSKGNDGADDNDYVGKDMMLPMVYTAVRMEQKKVRALCIRFPFCLSPSGDSYVITGSAISTAIANDVVTSLRSRGEGAGGKGI